jgi:hypothetical protein
MDRLIFRGVSATEVTTEAAVADGNTGLLVTYGAAGDTIFLAGVSQLSTSDLVL